MPLPLCSWSPEAPGQDLLSWSSVSRSAPSSRSQEWARNSQGMGSRLEPPKPPKPACMHVRVCLHVFMLHTSHGHSLQVRQEAVRKHLKVETGHDDWHHEHAVFHNTANGFSVQPSSSGLALIKDLWFLHFRPQGWAVDRAWRRGSRAGEGEPARAWRPHHAPLERGCNWRCSWSDFLESSLSLGQVTRETRRKLTARRQPSSDAGHCRVTRQAGPPQSVGPHFGFFTGRRGGC